MTHLNRMDYKNWVLHKTSKIAWPKKESRWFLSNCQIKSIFLGTIRRINLHKWKQIFNKLKFFKPCIRLMKQQQLMQSICIGINSKHRSSIQLWKCRTELKHRPKSNSHSFIHSFATFLISPPPLSLSLGIHLQYL